MKELATELLREKFVIHDPTAGMTDDKGPTIALSNRMVIPLKNDKGEIRETIIVRAQNVHGCVRMAARIIQAFESGGPLLNRAGAFNWETTWDVVSGDYERNFNPHRWIALYHNGKLIFSAGPHHPLLDIIENRAASAHTKYADSIRQAEEIIRKSGKVVRIEYDGNVALTVDLEKAQGRCGIILRSANKTTTFNFSVAAKNDEGLNIPQCLGTAAAFLEGIQLAFTVGMNGEKVKRGLIERHSTEEKHTQEGARRLGRLNAEIANLEAVFTVRYRPEKPEFGRILGEAERLAQKILPPGPEGHSH
ncbi:MAG: hypothetical protein WBK77_02110 [Alphaproteobacteria bacterium]